MSKAASSRVLKNKLWFLSYNRYPSAVSYTHTHTPPNHIRVLPANTPLKAKQKHCVCVGGCLWLFIYF